MIGDNGLSSLRIYFSSHTCPVDMEKARTFLSRHFHIYIDETGQKGASSCIKPCFSIKLQIVLMIMEFLNFLVWKHTIASLKMTSSPPANILDDLEHLFNLEWFIKTCIGVIPERIFYKIGHGFLIPSDYDRNYLLVKIPDRL